MAETYKKILKDNSKVQVESAIRDGEGVKISTNYAKKSEIPDVSNFITKSVDDLTNYTLSTGVGTTIDLSINSSTYVVTLSLKNSSGTVLSTDTIDLPLESVVVSGSYDDTTKKIVLTLQSGSTVEFSVADLVSGLQSEITSNNKLSSDLVDDTNKTNKFVTASEKTTWSGKQDAITSSNKLSADNVADGTTNKVYTGTEQTKLSGIESGAEVNDVTDVQIGGTSILSSKVANIVTNSTYNASSNKIATMSDLPTKVSDLTNDSGFITSETNQKVKTSSVTFGDNDVVEIKAGSNVIVTGDATNKTITIDATDTTYESKSASNGGTAVSLVTTGEKYTWNNKSNFSGSYNDLTDKPTIPTVPTNVSAFTNDAGYITSYTDTGATSVETTGDGNAVSSASYDSATRKLTLTKGVTALTSHQDISGKQDKTDNSLQTTATTVVGAINEVNSIAKESNKAEGYASYSALITALNSASSTKYNVGQSFYIQTLEVPDLWIISVESSSSSYTYTTDSAFITATGSSGGQQVGYYKLAQLETQKVDLSNYSLKSATVSDVTYDSSNKKLKKTINGTTSDVVTFGANAFTSTSIPIYVEGNTTGTSPIWTATSSAITSYENGMIIAFKIGIAGVSGTQTTLNINSLGAKKVFENNNTNPSTHYTVGSILIMTYDSSADSENGAWKIAGDRVGTDAYTVRTYNYTGSNYDRDLLCRQDTASITDGNYTAKYVASTTKASINTSTGKITAGGFAVTNGTSSQFLKADGSVETLSIPTVNNASLNIQLNGTNVNTFTANASSDVIANIQALPNYSLSIGSTNGGNPRQVLFCSVNYTNFDSNSGAYFKLGAMSGHGNGSSYTFVEDIFINVNYQGTVTCNVYKYVQQSVTLDNVARNYGDIFWTIDTTNKIVYFYILLGQYSSAQFTPGTKIGLAKAVTSANGIIQYTGTPTYYSSGDKTWATGNSTTYAKLSDIPTNYATVQVYNSDADALSASQQDPNKICLY